MKMAKASESDLKMALDLTQALDAFERGYFPYTDDMDNTEDFDRDNLDHCWRAMDMILDKLGEGSLSRVVFGMSVLLNPKNEAIDHSLDYLEHHPKVRMHGELIEMLHMLRCEYGRIVGGPIRSPLCREADALLAKIDDPENVAQRLAAAQAFAKDC